MDQKMPDAAFQQQVLQKLDNIETLLKQLVSVAVTEAPPARAVTEPASVRQSQQPPREENIVEDTRLWYNQLWDSGADRESVLESIQMKMAGDPKACVIGFRDDALCLTDNSYAEFDRNKSGRAFVLSCPNGGEGTLVFMAFPYPASDIWFERGSLLLERMYLMQVNGYYLHPRIQITDVALLEGNQPEGGERGEMVYRPYKMGKLHVMMDK